MNPQDHLTNAEKIAYWQVRLAPERLLEMSDHLQECATCREELRCARPTKSSVGDVSYEELIAYMEGKLDPLTQREIAGRIANSSLASAELADLRRFHEEMEALPAHDYSLLEAAAPWRASWILPIAAGVALGLGFLWLSTAQQNVGSVALQDGGKQIVVRRNGSVPALGSLPPELQSSLREAASSGMAPLPDAIAQLRGSKETLAGAPKESGDFRLIEPVATLVESSRPALRWSAQKNATGYRVNLVSKSQGEAISSPILDAKKTEWTVERPLQPNETYEWEVEALRDGELLAKTPSPPEPEAKFAVLPNENREELQQLRERFGGSHLVMGLAYAKAGLIVAARREFETLARDNPKSALPRRLLANLP